MHLFGSIALHRIATASACFAAISSHHFFLPSHENRWRMWTGLGWPLKLFLSQIDRLWFNLPNDTLVILSWDGHVNALAIQLLPTERHSPPITYVIWEVRRSDGEISLRLAAIDN
jgi:hypothetical protein